MTRRAALVWTLVAALVAANILSHDAVQRLAARLGDWLTLERMSLYVTFGGIAGAAVIIVWCGLRLRPHPRGGLLTGYVVATLLLSAIAYNTLFMINTEAIHYPQYALIGMVMLPITGSFVESIAWVTLFGALDEAWQYWVLSREVPFVYLDFNDMILNLLGGALGVLLMAVLLRDAIEPRQGERSVGSPLGSAPVRVAAAIIVAAAIGLLSGVVSVYPDADATVILARAGRRPVVWATSYWGKTAHVLSPFNGLLLMVALVGLYVPLDRRLRFVRRSA